MAQIKELWIYPIKGCRGVQVPHLPMTALGAHLDRHWMLVDEGGRFITQREEPRLALIELFVDTQNWSQQTEQVRVKVENDFFDLRLDLESKKATTPVTIWGQECKALAVAEDLAVRLSQFLGRQVSIVQVHQSTQRQVSKKYQNIDASVAFADGYPFLAVFTASLNDLNSRLDDKITMDRFRANIVIQNDEDEPFMEDQLKFIVLGQYEFSIKPCSRCVVINTDQLTGVRAKGGGPLKVLAKYRNFDRKVNFGINLVHKSNGILQIGDQADYVQN